MEHRDLNPSSWRPCHVSMAVVCVTLVAGCAPHLQLQGHDKPIPSQISRLHTPAQKPEKPEGTPPQLIQSLSPAASGPVSKPAVFNVVVNRVDVQTLLFTLAKDAKVNLDIHPDVTGTVTLNALSQTLPQILARVEKQTDIRCDFENGTLIVRRDLPYPMQYKVDYVNLNRDATINMSVNTQLVGSISGGSTSSASSGSGSGSNATDNSATTRLVSTSSHRFWRTLETNLNELLGTRLANATAAGSASASGSASGGVTGATGTAGSAPSASGTGTATGASSGTPLASAASTALGLSASGTPAGNTTGSATDTATSIDPNAPRVFVNAEAGYVTVLGKRADHEKVQSYLSKIIRSVQKQVLIEATIAEVELSDAYSQGVNWTAVRNRGLSGSITPGTANIVTQTANAFGYTGRVQGADLTGTLKLLEQFGRVKVLSSPKVSALNNQTALLKVVRNEVYFTIEVQTTPAQGNSQPITTYQSKLNTVPVGLIMSVTPQINDNGVVTLSLRPTISEIADYKDDPGPRLNGGNVDSKVPIIKTREIESVLQVPNGELAVMGGLIQDRLETKTDQVPNAEKASVFSFFLTQKNNTATKTELLIFIRPIVVDDFSRGAIQARMGNPGAQWYRMNGGL